MSATEVLRSMLDKRGVEWGNVRNDGSESGHLTEWQLEGIQSYAVATEWPGGLSLETHRHYLTPEQVIAEALGRQKAKAHPYGYEPDTGAFDVTRCECGCLNDISATYCNDCGGVIEVDVNAEKEIYKYSPRNSVFATKHDDGSLEFGGKRYVAATLGSGTLTADQLREAATLGGGECIMEYGGDVAEVTARAMGVYFCSECGSPNYNDCMPYYCIYCGKAVKR